MTENHFRSHFSPLQINTQLYFFSQNGCLYVVAAILNDRKSLLIALLAISDQNASFLFLIFVSKWRPAAIWDDRKSLSIAFLAISDQYTT